MKKNPLVSIIVPVYNAEVFINRCVDSILNQTHKNIEAIFIDDGSKDNSLKILRKYSQDNKNIKVFNQKNAGPGIARNLGLKKATGDYITFVDSDDYIEKDYIKELLSKIKNNDIIISGYKICDENMKLISEKLPTGENIDHFKCLSTWCKLYKRTLIVENDIIFPPRKIGEDLLFTLKCYSCTSKITTLKKSGYVNIINKSSITHTISKKNRADLFSLIKEIDNGIDLKKYDDLYLYFYLKTLVMNLLMQPKNLKFEEYYKIYKDSFDWLEKRYQKNNRKMKLKWQNGEEFKINLCINIFIFCKKTHLIKPFLYSMNKIKINL